MFLNFLTLSINSRLGVISLNFSQPVSPSSEIKLMKLYDSLRLVNLSP